MSSSSWLARTWLTVCLGLHCGLLAWEANRTAPTYDELSYLPAGICHLQTGRFELNRVSPPLVRTVAALPVVLAGPVTEWSGLTDLPGPRADREFAERFWLANEEKLFWYFTIARWACIPFSVLGGAICYAWAKQLYGPASGLLAVTLWCFCPNILAHAQLLTADAGAAALGVAACYCFWRWLREPSWTRVFISGGVLGLAELAKTTWIVLFALWPVLWLALRWRDARRTAVGAGGEFVQLLTVLVLAVMAINLGYLYEGSFQPLGHFQFISRSLAGPDVSTSSTTVGNRFSQQWLGSVPMPLPKDYIKGIDIQKRDLEVGQWSYLRGEWRRGGWWYYYLYGLAIKVPLGTLAMAVLALIAACFWSGFLAPAKDEWVLLAPPLVVLVLVSAQTGFNHHLRYVLPIFPFAFILISRLGRSFDLQQRGRSIVISVLLAWSIASSLAIYPHSLSYFNELAGGPVMGGEHLLSSNLDWGQDLLFLKRWAQEHPEAKPIMLAYTIPRLAGAADIEYELPPIERDAPSSATDRWPAGWYAISAGFRQSRDGRYELFRHMQPVGRAGYSINIYRLEPDSLPRAGGTSR